MQPTACGAMPDMHFITSCRQEHGAPADCPRYIKHSTCAHNNNTLVVVDKACNGCASRVWQQNIWHLMTRAYTVWTVNAAVADIYFYNKGPLGALSNDLWRAVVGGRVLRSRPSACKYGRTVTVYDMSARLSDWFSDRVPRDRLWTIGMRRASCWRTPPAVAWQTFVSHMLGDSIPVSAMRKCLFLRKALNDTSKTGRVESNANEIVHRNGLSPVLFAHTTSFRGQTELARTCRVAVGLHGAQLMHAMWMRPMSALVEYDSPRSRHEYYRNIAHLSGHIHVAPTICNKEHCDARYVNSSVHIDSTRLGAILEDTLIKISTPVK